MNKRMLWSRILTVIGTVALFSVLDINQDVSLVGPLVGGAMISLSAYLAGSRFRRLAYWAFGLTTIGGSWMVIISALGGFGGETGQSTWWALTLLPYPVGWILCLIAGVRLLIEWCRGRREASVPHGDQHA